MIVKEGNTCGLSFEEKEQRYRCAYEAFQHIRQYEITALSSEEKRTLAHAVDNLIPLYQEANAREHVGYDSVLSLDNRAVLLRDSILFYNARFLTSAQKSL